jgi:hypothetical protein
MGSVRRRGQNAFELVYQVGGRRRYETFHCKNKTEAETELRKREGKALEGRLPVDNFRLTFDDLKADLLNEYQANERRSLKSLKSHLVHLTAYFGGWRAVDINTAAARAYAATRRRENAEPSTVNRELAKLKRMFSLAVQSERLQHRPYIPLLKENNVRHGFFEAEAFDVVLKKWSSWVWSGYPNR